jgi:YggT family protein
MPYNPIIGLLDIILGFYWFVVMAAVIVSWLAAFNIINERNDFVRTALRILYSLTEPVFRPIRRVIPAVAGLDLSPLIVLLAIFWLRGYVLPWLNFHLGF